MSVSGLAEGFLAGFNTMDNYQRGQKADERAEREMSLRDAMFKQNTANSNRDFSLRQAEFDNRVDQQKVTNDQWGQEFDLKRKEADSLRAYRNDNLVLAQAAERRAKESHALAVAKNKRDQWWLDNEVPFNMATAALGRGEQITPEQDDPLIKKRKKKENYGLKR